MNPGKKERIGRRVWLRKVSASLAGLAVVVTATGVTPARWSPAAGPKEPTRYLITGVPAYKQVEYTNKNGKEVLYGCGPCAALMLLAYYDRRLGFKDLIPTSCEGDEVPEDLIQELRDRMKTVVVGGGQGLTEPTLFKSGLKRYIKQHYDVKMHEKNTLWAGTLEKVFEQSVELIQSNKPHVICFDWQPTGGFGSNLFANHYSVVVGYNKRDGKRKLIINPGWGDSSNYQIIDLADKDIKPVRIMWLEMQGGANGPQDAHSIGPDEQSAHTDFVKQADGSFRLVPSLAKYSDPDGPRVSWEQSDETKFPITGDQKADMALPSISFNKWFD